MDHVSQIQEYCVQLCATMASTIDQLQHQVDGMELTDRVQTQPVSVDELQAMQHAQGSVAATAKKAGEHEQPRAPSSSSSSPSSSSDKYTLRELHPALDGRTRARVHEIMTKYAELDFLVASLPAHYPTERQLLAEIEALAAESQHERDLFERTKADALLMQQRVSHVLQHAAGLQLNSTSGLSRSMHPRNHVGNGSAASSVASSVASSAGSSSSSITR